MGYPELTPNAIRVLEARYLRRGDDGEIVESPEQLFERVARAIASVEDEPRVWEERFFELMRSLDFLPNSPTLMNAGTPLGQLSACFVLPVEDDLDAIFEAIKRMALVQRTGGGTGFSFSELRPKGDPIRSTGGEASGPVSFMRIFDAATANIKQGGKRRGANLGVLRVDHPDILEFATAKLDETSLTNFNISVGATDAFFEAVRDDTTYDLVHPRTGRVVSTLRAREIFDVIVDAAWRSGDPGLLFLDAIHRANPLAALGRIEAANPCGEVPLLPHESCNLGSVNLSHMLRDGGSGPEIDWERLAETVRTAVRFLDDVIDANRYPFPEIERATKASRKIGLGVMGFAELLIRLGIPYDSEPAVGLADRLMGFVAARAREASEELGELRGTFPSWEQSTYAKDGVRIRNATRTAIAPTGTIGIIAGTTPSIEPLFALAYRRAHVLDDQTLVEVSPLVRDCLSRAGGDTERILEEVLRTGSLKRAQGVPPELARLLENALEIPAERHLDVQAAFQRHVDNSVSKTVNLPESATRAEVERIYLRAWELGLKGVTIFRFGSRSQQVIELGAHESAAEYDAGARCDPHECRV